MVYVWTILGILIGGLVFLALAGRPLLAALRKYEAARHDAASSLLFLLRIRSLVQ